MVEGQSLTARFERVSTKVPSWRSIWTENDKRRKECKVCLGVSKKLSSRIAVGWPTFGAPDLRRNCIKKDGDRIQNCKETWKRKERKEFFSRFTRVNSLVTTKWTYYNSISGQPCTIFATKKSAKKYLVILIDEGQSFAEVLSEFSGKTMELKQVMHGRVTEKPWCIVNENDKARSTAKSTFCNLLQQNSTVPSSKNVPADTVVWLLMLWGS